MCQLSVEGWGRREGGEARSRVMMLVMLRDQQVDEAEVSEYVSEFVKQSTGGVGVKA